MRRSLALVPALLLVLSASACGGDDSSGSASTATTKTIDITFEGDSVTPSGEEVDVKVGQPIELDVTADKAGEIHVHSSPEQEKEYAAGSSTIALDPITVPGQVVVESHSLDKVIVTLQVTP